VIAAILLGACRSSRRKNGPVSVDTGRLPEVRDWGCSSERKPLFVLGFRRFLVRQRVSKTYSCAFSHPGDFRRGSCALWSGNPNRDVVILISDPYWVRRIGPSFWRHFGSGLPAWVDVTGARN